jgi:peptidyl-prolyl cis-trans isomerase SDCCAG10
LDDLYQQLSVFLSFQTLALLSQFKSKLTQAITETPENSVPEAEVEDDEGW